MDDINRRMANTLTCPFPNNLDILTVNGFNLSITKLPGVSFFCQEANIPAVKQEALSVPTPLSIMKQPSSMLTYDTLEVAFHVDDKMDNYTAVYTWMKQLGFPETREQFQELWERADNDFVSDDSKVFSTGFLQVLGTNNLAVRTIEYVDMFPITLSTAVFSSGLSDVKYLMGRASFAFSYYQIK
jgi:hypothetical protein